MVAGTILYHHLLQCLTSCQIQDDGSDKHVQPGAWLYSYNKGTKALSWQSIDTKLQLCPQDMQRLHKWGEPAVTLYSKTLMCLLHILVNVAYSQ